MVHGYRRTSSFLKPLKYMADTVCMCIFFFWKKIQSFDQILKAFSSPLPLCPLLWRVTTLGIGRCWWIFRRMVWSDLCLQRSLLIIWRSIWSSLFIRRRNYTYKENIPSPSDILQSGIPPNKEFPTSVWHSILLGNHYCKWEQIFKAWSTVWISCTRAASNSIDGRT